MRLWQITKKLLVVLGHPWIWAFKKGANIFIRAMRRLVHVSLGIWVIYFGLTVVMLVASAGAIWLYFEVFKDLPSVNLIYNPPRLSTKIYDRNGKLLYKFYENENRTWVPLERIPRSLIEATLAIEDKDFYNHHGLSPKGIVGAIIYNLKGSSDGKVRGGSTITQQLVKNVFFSSEKSLRRKLREAVLSVEIEEKLNKNEILERYFNQIPYGGETYGVEEAALKYFQKNVWEIDEAQAAYLAGLPAAPTSYSPGDEGDIDYGSLRMEHVIREMFAANYISEAKEKELLATKIKINKTATSIEAPHFVFYVRSELRNKFGYENFERMGLKVTTSLNLDIQDKAEEIVRDEVAKAKQLRISNGAAIITDVASGDILAMVGSKDYWARDIDGKYNVTTALRQPGSSIKPINYLLALEKGKTLMSTVEDSPITFPSTGPGQKPYSPHNYNGKFMGTVTLKTALASSLNIPSVKLLAENGIGNMIDLGEKMGITTWTDRSRFGLALALGGGEVKMVDMAQAYSIFANLGEKVEVSSILSIDNYLGENVYKKATSKVEVVDPKHAFLINRALSDDQARAPVFGLNSKLVIPGKTVAVKTGTTNNLKDNWCIGWTPSYLVATWVGNNDGSLMSWVASGVSGATPIWNRIMKTILADKPDEKWTVPAGVAKENVCGKDEYFVKGSEGSVKCALTPTPTP